MHVFFRWKIKVLYIPVWLIEVNNGLSVQDLDLSPVEWCIGSIHGVTRVHNIDKNYEDYYKPLASQLAPQRHVTNTKTKSNTCTVITVINFGEYNCKNLNAEYQE